MKPTQLDKIINLCRDGNWVCQSQFWLISKSPHKRRGDIEKEGIWKFEPRTCEHGIKNSHDFRMVAVGQAPKEYKVEIVEVNGERIAKETIV